jgi:hypothetical protein
MVHLYKPTQLPAISFSSFDIIFFSYFRQPTCVNLHLLSRPVLLLHPTSIKMLCDMCNVAISDILACESCGLDSSRWRVEKFGPESHVFYLGDSRKIAENSSRKICFVCQTAHRWVPSRSKGLSEPFDIGESKSIFLSVPLKYAISGPLELRVIVVLGLSTFSQLEHHAHKPRSYLIIALELYLYGTLPD